MPTRAAVSLVAVPVAGLALLAAPMVGARGGVAGAAASPEVAAPQDTRPPEPASGPPSSQAGLGPFLAPWTGDLDGMVERRLVRVLTVRSPVLYFVDEGREEGLVYEEFQEFEKRLNETVGSGVAGVHVVLMPVARDELIPRLLAGQGDIAAATLTITPERQEKVDFSKPFVRHVNEVLVTGPDTPPLASLEALSGRKVFVPTSSSFAEHLRALNQRFGAKGRPPVEILAADETLDDGDILEMVAAGLVPATVVDSFIASLYTKVFPQLRVHPDVALSRGGEIAWAFRKDSPALARAVNAFLETHKEGSLSGNILIKRYLKTTKWVRNARSDEDLERFRSMIDLFRKYASRYDFDFLLMTAQGYQESHLDQSMRSRVGAVGVMQLMPATARDRAVNIPDIEELEPNIHAGIKYNRWIVDHYFDDPAIDPLNRHLLAFAAYNAGPSRISQLRKEAEEQGLDPNRWFNNVELVAARRIGRETVQYVANIYKYYVAYQMVVDEERLSS